MSNEQFFDKLRQTFKVLFIDRQNVHDDTLLDKFHSLLKQLLSSNNSKQVAVNVIEGVPWVSALVNSHSQLEPRVTAFGLKLIGDLASIPECKLLNVRTNLNGLAKDLAERFSSFEATVRCATLKMFQSILSSKLTDVLLANCDVLRVVHRGSVDSSIFVVRASRDFALDYLIWEMNDKNGREPARQGDDDAELQHPQTVLSWLTKSLQQQLTCDVTVKRTLFALDVFHELALKHTRSTELLCKDASLKAVVISCLQNSKDEAVCSACCNVLVSMNCWSFKDGIETEWINVLEMILVTKQLTTAGKFIVATCKKCIDNKWNVPQQLKLLLFSPLHVCFEWTICDEEHADSQAYVKWAAVLKQQLHDTGEMIKLCSHILTSVPSLQHCLSNSETVKLVNLLSSTLLAKNNQVVISPKIQATIMSALKSLMEGIFESRCPMDIKDMELLWTNLLDAADEPSSAMTIMKRMQMISIQLQNYAKMGLHEDYAHIYDRLNLIVQKRCFDVHWEVRDSAVEVIGKLMTKCNDDPFLRSWVLQSGLLKVLLSKLDDIEGYVKANALNVISIVLGIQQFQNDVQPQVSFERLIRIYLEEDEAVTRRAAAKAMLSWQKDSENSSVELANNVFLIAAADLDWEIKLTAMEYWQQQLEKATEIDGIVDFLTTSGFNDAIIHFATDPDITVQRNIQTVIQSLRLLPCIKHVCVNSKAVNLGGKGFADETEHSQQQQMQKECVMRDEDKYAAIDIVLDTVDSNIVENAMVQRSCVDLSCPSSAMELIMQHHKYCSKRTTTPDFIVWIQSLKLEELSEECSKTTDLYDNNPEALLDDMLYSNQESETEEEITIDCY